MERTHLNPSALSPPPGGIYSHVVKAGQMVYLSGQLARDAAGALVGAGDAAAQYRQVLANITVALESVGASLSDLVKTTTYVVGVENLTAVRAARQEHMVEPPPTSTMVVVAALASPGYLVEVDAIAVLDSPYTDP